MSAQAGERLVAVRHEVGSERLWMVEEGAPEPWIAEVSGLVGVALTAPDRSPRHIVVNGSGSGRVDGPPPEVTRVRVELRGSGRSFEAAVGRDAWLLVLPPDTGGETASIAFVRGDGTTWEQVSIEGLAGMLGEHVDRSPDGGGSTAYAPYA